MKMWEIRESASRNKSPRDAYDQGYEDGYEDALEEMENRSYKRRKRQ